MSISRNLSRRQLLQTGALLVHLPFPGIGVLRKKGTEFIFDPAPWQLF